MLVANEKKPLCGEKSKQLACCTTALVAGKLEKTVKLGRWACRMEKNPGLGGGVNTVSLLINSFKIRIVRLTS